MVEKNNQYYEFLKYAYETQANGLKTWPQLCYEFSEKFDDEMMTPDALRKRAKYAYDKTESSSVKLSKSTIEADSQSSQYTQHNLDGTIEASTIVNSIDKLNGDKTEILKLLGYNDNEWELLTWRITMWDGGTNGTTKYSVKYKVKPITTPSVNDYKMAVVKAITESIEPLGLDDIEAPISSTTNEKLLEIPPIELHLGKIASKLTTGEEYNVEVAKKRFFEIFEKIYEKQRKEKCEKCLLVIGSDFFNSEHDNATSTHRIPQQNCAHYMDIFTEGIKMYIHVINKLRSMFNTVNVMLCAGNHARAMEFFLYTALEQAYKHDSIIKFNKNYQETQFFEYGSNVIFFNHGDSDIKKLIHSIPAEFASIWGKHIYRELHLGHLHKEVVVDDESGMITRRIGSPCGTDVWHKLNRYVGATKKHQIFIWDKKSGLSNIFYIPTKIE